MQTVTKLPRFEGKSLIQIPETIPQANFLVGDFGKAVLAEYKGRAETEYNGNAALNVLSYDNGVVQGSNPFAVVLMNKVVESAGLHVATPADLELILRAHALPLGGQYEDSALALRTEGKQNTYLAQHLVKQVKARTGQNPKTTLMIPLAGLDIENDSASQYGLAFRLRENAELIEAPVLNKPGRFTSADVDPAIGLPRTTGKEGDRMLYTINSGLSRLFLYRDLDLFSNRGNLADSYGFGRVAVVGGAATATQNVEAEITHEYQRQLGELNKRHDRALSILKGKE